jgi:hypothetical protein
LLQAADAIRLAGDYVSMLNRAGQIYTHADKMSFPPEPPASPAARGGGTPEARAAEGT